MSATPEEFRRAFIAGAEWWHAADRATSMPAEARQRTEREAERRYGKKQGYDIVGPFDRRHAIRAMEPEP